VTFFDRVSDVRSTERQEKRPAGQPDFQFAAGKCHPVHDPRRTKRFCEAGLDGTRLAIGSNQLHASDRWRELIVTADPCRMNRWNCPGPPMPGSHGRMLGNGGPRIRRSGHLGPRVDVRLIHPFIKQMLA